MKRKSIVALLTGVLATAGLAVTGLVVFGSNNASGLSLAKANGKDSGSYTLTAADFTSGAGSVAKGGDSWNYENVTINGDIVTVKSVMYTTIRSGTSQSGGRRGDGYTRMVFDGLDLTDAVGLVFHETDSNGGVTKGGNPVSADVDLTFGGTVDSVSRRGLYFAQGGESTFSFKSLTLYYACTAVNPQITITSIGVQVGVGENAQLQTEKRDVYPGDTFSIDFSSSDNNIATVTSAGVVTGVAAGKATITATLTVNGVDYTDSTEVTVNAAAATVKEMTVLATSRIEGAGLFCRFSPASAGVTASDIDSFAESVSLEFADPTTDNGLNFYVLQEKGNDSYTVYAVCKSAVGLNNAFTVTADFKDNANNIIYRAAFHFDKGSLATEIELSAASFSVNEGEDLEITASKASFIEGEATFTFASLDANVFTVTANGNVATVHGVSEGSATLRVTMNVGEKAYTLDKTIAVTQAGVKHLIPWYTEGTGNQANHWLGAGIWTWVNYGELGYTWATFSQIKAQITVSYESDPATTVTVDTISDDLGAVTSARVYILAGAAYSTGVLTMSLPDANGVTYTGTITFVSGEATAYNSGL